MILVTGGTGAMGSLLVKRLAAKGERVRVLTMPHDPLVSRLAGQNVDIRYGDISRENDCCGVCKDINTVYHCAAIIIAPDDRMYTAINSQGTAHVVAEAAKSGVKHFIHVSSASVVYPKTTRYSQSKQEAESFVRNSGCNFTIVRPTLVCDRTGGQEFNLFLNYLRTFPVVPFIGPGKSLKRPVFSEDVINGLVSLYNNNKAHGKVYNLSGGEPISMIDFARMCLKLLGREHLRPVIHVPVGLCLGMAAFLKLFVKNPPLRWPVIAGVTQDADLDPKETMNDLGYNPRKVSEFITDCFPRT
jgi:NADH dehydrogenase